MMVILSSLGVGHFPPSTICDMLNRHPGSFPWLIIWDMQNPENSDIHARSLELCLGDPGVLDMMWCRDTACVMLIMLTTSGEHLITTFQNGSLTGNHISCGDITEGSTMNANSSQHSFKYGSITCLESIIASTVGSEVFLRDVKHSMFFLVIPSLILTDSLKIPPSQPLHLRTIFHCLMSLGSHTFISCQERDSLSFSCKSLKCT